MRVLSMGAKSWQEQGGASIALCITEDVSIWHKRYCEMGRFSCGMDEQEVSYGVSEYGTWK